MHAMSELPRAREWLSGSTVYEHLRAIAHRHMAGERSSHTLNATALEKVSAFAKAVKPGRHAGSCDTACC